MSANQYDPTQLSAMPTPTAKTARFNPLGDDRIARLLARHGGALEFLTRYPDASDQPIAQQVRALHKDLEPVVEHIANTWWKLIRTHEHLYLGATYDEKVPHAIPAVYISAKEDEEKVRAQLDIARRRVLAILAEVNTMRAEETPKEEMLANFADEFDKSVAGVIMFRNIRAEAEVPMIEIRRLPPRGEPFTPNDEDHGLLYLPLPYIVPGPRFDEMYNWDSAFVIRGLLQDGKCELAKDIVDNMLYQIEHYGTILNGTRTYYYDTRKPRSQPPLLTGQILGIYRNWDRLCGHEGESKLEWLKRAAKGTEDYYTHWVTSPHIHEPSGLSLYSSHLTEPCFEVIHSESTHYGEAFHQLLEMAEKHKELIVELRQLVPYGKAWDDKIEALDYQTRKDLYYIETLTVQDESGMPTALSPDFFRGDRAMRETGFDPSRRFGFFNVNVINYLPVCLNSLRLKMESDLSYIFAELEDVEPGQGWRARAEHWWHITQRTEAALNEWLWDDGEKARDGVGKIVEKYRPCYRDRNINIDLSNKYQIPYFRDYCFVTALYPLWVGAASIEQAAFTAGYIVPRLKTPWGILTSNRETGCQWDRPMMWAPLVLIAVEALERYDYYQDAFDIACGFLKTIVNDFGKVGKIYEKYHAEQGDSDISHLINKGYSQNVEGFAWTNSVTLELSRAIERLKYKLRGEPVPEEFELPVTTTTVKTYGMARAGRQVEDSVGGSA